MTETKATERWVVIVKDEKLFLTALSNLVQRSHIVGFYREADVTVLSNSSE